MTVSDALDEARLLKIEHRQVGLGKDMNAKTGIKARLHVAEGRIQALENQLFMMGGRLQALEARLE